MIILHFDLQPQFKCMSYFIYTSYDNKDNSLLGHYLFLVAHSFPRASPSENCSLLGTGNVRGQISELLLFIYILIFKIMLAKSLKKHGKMITFLSRLLLIHRTQNCITIHIPLMSKRNAEIKTFFVRSIIPALKKKPSNERSI